MNLQQIQPKIDISTHYENIYTNDTNTETLLPDDQFGYLEELFPDIKDSMSIPNTSAMIGMKVHVASHLPCSAKSNGIDYHHHGSNMQPIAPAAVNPANMGLMYPLRLNSISPDQQLQVSPIKTIRKRRLDAIVEPLVTGGKDILEEQRKERNRKHAKRSRQRKKSLTDDLQQSLMTLKEENSKLREEIYTAIGNKKKVDSMVDSKVSISTAQFIQELKGSKNRVVDDQTNAFLKNLAKNAMKCADEFPRVDG